MGKDPKKSIKKLRRKLIRLERELNVSSRSSSTSRSRSLRRSRTPSRNSTRARTRTRSRSRIGLDSSLGQISTLTAPEEEQDLKSKEHIDQIEIDLTEENTATTEEVNSDVLALLGNFPEDTIQGPELLPSIVTRWEAILKKGLEKEERKELIKKYPPPANLKMIDAPKLNPEVQAASSENILKKDRAMAIKQHQVSCALSALGLALNKMCKIGTENMDSIGLISDAARLLCDYHHTESSTRKGFILQGLEKSTREGIKDTKIDEWLFGADFAEKLKACKAIEKSGQDLKGGTQTKARNFTHKSHLNYKGRTNNSYKPKTQRVSMKPSAKQYSTQNKIANTPQASFRNRQQNQHRR